MDSIRMFDRIIFFLSIVWRKPYEDQRIDFKTAWEASFGYRRTT